MIHSEHEIPIHEYLDNELTPAERARFEEHLSTCPSCQQELASAGFGPITTEILDAPEFYYAEDYHQQYLAKNPNGYCGLGGTGVPLKD